MNNKSLIYMISAALCVMAALLVFNFMTVFKPPAPANELISKNDVKGIAIDYNNILWTLNFKQQNQVIDALNNAIPIGTQVPVEDDVKPSFKKLVIYKFNADPLEITPVTYTKNNMVFTASTASSNRLLRENTNGALKTLFLESYDH